MNFDILVIGGGTAGCVAASRLSENVSCRVGLVEAGGLELDPDIADPLKWGALPGRTYDWAYQTVPQAFTAARVHAWPRGRLLGGSSGLNAMAHVRGHPRDFDAWEQAAGPRWSYAGLLSGFTRSEEKLGLLLPDSELSPVVRAFMAAGVALGAPRLRSHNGADLTGASANSLTIRNGKRATAADAYLTPEVLGRPNLTLLLHHEAEQLVFRESKVAGLAAVHAGETRIITASTVLLCLGAIATPLLLMRSGIGDPAMLARAGITCTHGLPDIGLNLQDHLLVLGNVYRSANPVPPSRLQHSESLMYLDSGDITRAHGAPDIVVACVAAPAVSEQFATPAYGSAYTLLAGVTHPTSRGHIAPTGPGRNDPPLIDPQYLATEYDRLTLRAALQMARRIGHHAAFAQWRSQEVLPGSGVTSDEALDHFIARSASTHHHPSGTCAMGTVVDEALRVRGFDNLFAADASVIPALPSGPINAAVMAIAETWCEMFPQYAQ